MIDISSWLLDCEYHKQQSTVQIPNRKRQRTTSPTPQRPLTPQSATPRMSSAGSRLTTPRHKRRKQDHADDTNDETTYRGGGGIDPNRTPLAAPPSAQSDTTTSGDASTTTSSHRSSPVKRLLRLEIAPQNPLSVVSINRRDDRMPRELKIMLARLEDLQRGHEVVPRRLADEVQARRTQQRRRKAKEQGASPDCDESDSLDEEDEDDGDFYNFGPSVYSAEDEAPYWRPISLDDVMDVLIATQLCTNDVHPESSWNMLVHWPIFKLALGVAGTDIPTTATTASAASPTTCIRVSCVPCTTARLTGHSRGSKMVDFCMALSPPSTTQRQCIRDLRGRTDGSTVNHTDFYPLRDKPVIVSVESKKPGDGLLEAQTQVGVWQAAQWSLLLRQAGGLSPSLVSGSGSGLPFLPALFIQGPQWSFAATTRHGEQTLLWTQQSIGTTDTMLGIFQIVAAIRYIAQWSIDVYWPWYHKEVLAVNTGGY
ncbi:hypothetical protein F4803DRAFT_545404 [Xylaria telfairii]|nr:hypothetical protein F4803DRAFT_545404 [Xylaria telfairii]